LSGGVSKRESAKRTFSKDGEISYPQNLEKEIPLLQGLIPFLPGTIVRSSSVPKGREKGSNVGGRGLGFLRERRGKISAISRLLKPKSGEGEEKPPYNF